MDYGAEHILRYLNNDMEAREKQAFERALLQDKDLQERLEACRESLAYYRQTQTYAAETEALRQMTAELGRQYFPAAGKAVVRKQPLFQSRRLIAMAAALVLLVFAGYHWLSVPDPLATYGHVPTITVTERGAAADQDKAELAVLLNKKDYAAALPLARKVLEADSANVSNQLYYGLCLLHTAAYDDARHWLQPVYAGNSLLKYRAAILIGLSYQQQGLKPDAKSILQQVPADAAEYREAQALLRQIR